MTRTITVTDKFKEVDSRLRELEFDLGECRKNVDAFKAFGEQLQTLNLKVNQEALKDKISMIVFSGEFDKLVAAFIIAAGAAAMGTEVVMFFTFWGLTALTKKARVRDKSFIHRMLGFMLPRGTAQAKTSHFNMGGIGPALFRKLMKDGGVASLEDLTAVAFDLDVKIKTCEMSKTLLGITDDELIGKFETVGVTSFLNDARESKTTLFI